MRKYNFSNIMKRAHSIKSENALNVWSECLKMAWNEAKAPVVELEEIVIETSEMGGEMRVVKETEKAVQIVADSDYGTLTFWCPKSCIYATEELRKEIQEKAHKVTSGLKYNEILLSLAKENAIKSVRKGTKTLTLVRKLTAAGVEVPER